VMNDIPPSAIPVAQATAAKVTAPPPQARAASRHAICRAAPCVQ
jgi:hypothetical protein